MDKKHCISVVRRMISLAKVVIDFSAGLRVGVCCRKLPLESLRGFFFFTNPCKKTLIYFSAYETVGAPVFDPPKAPVFLS